MAAAPSRLLHGAVVIRAVNLDADSTVKLLYGHQEGAVLT